ncbi:MAG: SDR family oxidoreductase [Chloroflexi bacterium]|nr:SDR family oxidoreductase [Chloroflexota bacterium]
MHGHPPCTTLGRSHDPTSTDLRAGLLKRAGTPDDIAYAAVYLASDESPHTTGENLVVDTGITLGRGAKQQAERGAAMQRVISGE